MAAERSAIAGTAHTLQPGEHILGDAQPGQTLTVSVLLRRAPGDRAPSAEDLLSGRAKPMGRDAAESALRARPSDMAAVADWLSSQGLHILDQDAATRHIRAQGTISQMESAFGVQMKRAEVGESRPYVTYQGTITVPSSLAGIVVAVLGLDNRPVATHH